MKIPFRIYRCPLLTLLFLLAVVVFVSLWFRIAGYDFLSVHQPLDAGILVIESWLPDASIDSVATWIKHQSPGQILVPGTIFSSGLDYLPFPDQASFTRQRLIDAGVDSVGIVTLVYEPVQRDRTYHAALVCKAWLQRHDITPGNCTVVTLGPHARRSLYLYKLAFKGTGFQIGVYAIEPVNYSSRNWYQFSAGVRTLIGEWLAWFYARIWFSPDS